MNFLYVNEQMVLQEIIYENDPIFPGVAVEDRYSDEFLSKCIRRTAEQIESEGIEVGMVYDADSDSFTMPEEPEPEPEPEGYTITEEEVSAAYEEGVNNVE